MGQGEILTKENLVNGIEGTGIVLKSGGGELADNLINKQVVFICNPN